MFISLSLQIKRSLNEVEIDNQQTQKEKIMNNLINISFFLYLFIIDDNIFL